MTTTRQRPAEQCPNSCGLAPAVADTGGRVLRYRCPRCGYAWKPTPPWTDTDDRCADSAGSPGYSHACGYHD